MSFTFRYTVYMYMHVHCTYRTTVEVRGNYNVHVYTCNFPCNYMYIVHVSSTNFYVNQVNVHVQYFPRVRSTQLSCLTDLQCTCTLYMYMSLVKCQTRLLEVWVQITSKEAQEHFPHNSLFCYECVYLLCHIHVHVNV